MAASIVTTTRNVGMKIAALDVETTGLDPKNCAITQIAIIPRVNGEDLEPFVSYVRPHEGASISEDALRIQGKTRAEIMEYPTVEEVMPKLLRYLDDNGGMFYLLGQNVKFDQGFLYHFFTRQRMHTEYILRFRPKMFCTLELAKKVFHSSYRGAKPEKFNLGSLCKFFNISLENAHDALHDIRATVTLWDSLKALETPPVVVPREALSYHEKRLKYLGAGYCMINDDGSVFINPSVTQDKEALEFVLTELHEIFNG